MKNESERRKKLLQRQFLAMLVEESGLVSYACDRVGISRQTHYNWLRTDAEYRRDYREAATEAQERRYKNVCKSAYASARRGSQKMQKWILKKHGEEVLHQILAGGEPNL